MLAGSGTRDDELGPAKGRYNRTMPVLAMTLAAVAMLQPEEAPRVVLTDAANRFRVEIETQAFAQEGREVTFESELVADTAVSKLTRIDARYPWGAGDAIPLREFKSFSVELAGKPVAFPRAMWEDCYNPVLLVEDEGRTLWAWPARDGSRLVIKMNGGASPFAYTVNWTLYPDKAPTRTFHVAGKPADDVTPPKLEEDAAG